MNDEESKAALAEAKKAKPSQFFDDRLVKQVNGAR